MSENEVKIESKGARVRLVPMPKLPPLTIQFSEETQRFIDRPYYRNEGEYLIFSAMPSEDRFERYSFHLQVYAVNLVAVPDTFVTEMSYIIDGRRYARPHDFYTNNLDAWVAGLNDCPVLEKTRYHEDVRAFPLTDTNVLRVLHTISSDHVLFADDLAAMIFQIKYLEFYQQCNRALKQAEFKENPTEYVPRLSEYFIDHPERPLTTYQKFVIEFSQDANGSAYFLEQGLGKTAISIANICTGTRKRMAEGKGMSNILIIGPNAVRLNWVEEFKRFSTLDCGATVLRGTATERLKKLIFARKGKPDWKYSAVICGYDSAANDIDALLKIDWDEIYFDESHFFKSSRTKRWKVLRLLRNVAGTIYTLTGTPYGNTILDLYTQLEMISPGLSGFGSEEAFKSFHGRYEYAVGESGQQFAKLVGENNVPFLKERLARNAVILTKTDVGMQLPDKVYSVLEAELTTDKKFLGGRSQAEVYRDLADKLMSEIEIGGEATAVEVNHVLTKLLRLAQVTSGHLKTSAVISEETGETVPSILTYLHDGPFNNPKIKVLFEDFDTLKKTSKAIVWAHFRPDIELLERAFKARGIGYVKYYGGMTSDQREESYRRFNEDPNVRVFIGNPASAGVGLNLLGYNYKDPEDQQLETNCDTMYFFSQNWSYLTRSQGEDRAHRRGTRSSLRIIDILVPDSIDIQIHDAVREKKKSALSIQDIREVLQNLR